MALGLGRWGYRSPRSLGVCGSQRLRRDELRCQYWGEGETGGGGKVAPPPSPWGLGEGMCSPLRVGEWLLPHSMAMYKENRGQIVHWEIPGVRGGGEGASHRWLGSGMAVRWACPRIGPEDITEGPRAQGISEEGKAQASECCFRFRWRRGKRGWARGSDITQGWEAHPSGEKRRHVDPVTKQVVGSVSYGGGRAACPHQRGNGGQSRPGLWWGGCRNQPKPGVRQ